MSPTSPAGPTVTLFVNGTLMRGEPLHGNLSGTAFRGDIATMPYYRLLSVDDNHPAMIPAGERAGFSIAGELYEMSLEQLQHVLVREPAGLGLGVVDLEGGIKSLGICWTAPEPPAHSIDISSFGGWREYRTSRRPARAVRTLP
jgi:gamma-glutamylcyclotransferase (GGCT)/AIG2-like uncharacterized protein YtfP